MNKRIQITASMLALLLSLYTFSGYALERQWTVMVYLAGANLEKEAINDFLRLAKVASSDKVSFAVQLDRCKYGDRRYGNWVGTRRGLVRSNDIPDANWGESLDDLNMADGATLKNFITWAHSTYPASKNALIIWNHGYGIRGMCDDLNADGEWERILFPELGQALDASGLQFDMVGFMICNGAMIELASYVAPYTDIFTASERTIKTPSTWPFDSIGTRLVASPDMSGAAFGKTIVDCFGTYHQGSNAGHSMSAIDLSKLRTPQKPIPSFLDELANAILSEASVDLYTSIDTLLYQNTTGFSMISAKDIGVMLKKLEQSDLFSSNIRDAARNAYTDYEKAVIANFDGVDTDGSGLCIYWPREGLTKPFAHTVHYRDAIPEFTNRSKWDEFLKWWGKKGTEPVGVQERYVIQVEKNPNDLQPLQSIYLLNGRTFSGFTPMSTGLFITQDGTRLKMNLHQKKGHGLEMSKARENRD